MQTKNFYTPPPVELDIDSAGFEGVCISRLEDKVVFTKYTVPGDRVLATIQKNRKRFFEAKVEKILVESPDRITPPCRYFGTCGGCSWQNMTYEKQLEWKSVNVRDVFQRIGKIDTDFKQIMGAEMEYGYRNKMEFSFGASRWLTEEEINSGLPIEDKDFAFGLHLPGRYDKIIDIKSCDLQQSYANEILNAVRLYAGDFKLSAYNVRSHEGFLRGLIIRHSKLNDEFLTIMITQKPKTDEENKFIEWYKNDFSTMFTKVSTAVYAINESGNPVDISGFEIVKGDGFIKESILGIEYKISPFSFFQTNSYQLDKFIGLIIEAANLNSQQTVWDLYCGTGSIALPASKYSKKVIGIEIVDSSIRDAKENAGLNGIDNVEFITADLHHKRLPGLLNSLDRPDVVITDPPRAGMSPNLINHLLDIAPGRIVYVSCNPATQARDCALLSEKYQVLSVQPVDMFPQTYHIECVAILQKRD